MATILKFVPRVSVLTMDDDDSGKKMINEPVTVANQAALAATNWKAIIDAAVAKATANVNTKTRKLQINVNIDTIEE